MILGHAFQIRRFLRWDNDKVINCTSVDVAKVTIVDNVVIGAGSVATKDIPSNVIAVGNPYRIVREITDEDKKYYYKSIEFDDEGWAAAVARNPKLEE